MSKKVKKKINKDVTVEIPNIIDDAQQLFSKVLELKGDIDIVISKAENLRNDVGLVSKQLDTAKSVIERIS